MEKPPALHEPPIHAAARTGDLAALARILAEGVAVDQRADIEVDNGCYLRGLTPLMTAARSFDGASVDTLRYLLNAGADLHAKSQGGVTAAWYAAGRGGRWWFHESKPLTDQAERLRFLLDAGLDPRECGTNGRSLLTEACSAGDPLRVRLLLERNVPAEPGFSEEASRKLWDETVHGVYSRISPEAPDLLSEMRREGLDSYQIPLFEAAKSGNEKCIALLIEHGADVSRVDSFGRTALAYVSSVPAARALLDAGADPNAGAGADDDVLDVVLTNGCGCSGACSIDEPEQIADVLIEAGARIDRATAFSKSRLRAYSFRNAADAVDYLLKKQTFARDLLTDALLGICWQGEGDADKSESCERIIRALVAAGAEVNPRDNQNSRPLVEAVSGDWSSPTAVRVLLELGADPNLATDTGVTPLMLAGDQACKASIEMLLAAGADTSLRDEDGRTALDWAEAHLQVWKSIVASPPDIPTLPGESAEDQDARNQRNLAEATEAVAILRAHRAPRRSWVRKMFGE